MPVTANLSEVVAEPITATTQNVDITPKWEITDIEISNKNKYINVFIEKWYKNAENVTVILSRDKYVIMDADFITMAMTVINGQTFYTALKMVIYNYLLSKGYISGTVS